MNTTADKRRIFSVSRLNQEVQQLLEGSFGTLWLQGELSNFSRPASGHCYFSLKDSQSQIRCAMFRSRNRYMDFKPQNGDAVLVRGKLGLYSARGDFQLIVEHMEPAGAGQLQAAFEAARRKLDELGYFDQASKLPLPSMPDTIGVITSATGAAIRDVLQVLARRYPQAGIVLYPTTVQGAAAAPSIVRAINRAAQRAEADVLLLVRGGGSLEDLWAFNEVAVAQAIRQCPIPLVAGVGHEVDVTIADLVADLRAPTPSAAAELATPDGMALLQRASQAFAALNRALDMRLNSLSSALSSLDARLQARHPLRQIFERGQRIDELEGRLLQSLRTGQQHRTVRLDALQRQLHSHSPAFQLAPSETALRTWQLRLYRSVQTVLQSHRSRWQLASHSLHTVSPLATLERGFAVVRHAGKVITTVDDVNAGDTLTTHLVDGEIDSQVLCTKTGKLIPPDEESTS